MVTKLQFLEGAVSVITVSHGGAPSGGREPHLDMFPLTAPSSHLRTSKNNQRGADLKGLEDYKSLRLLCQSQLSTNR